ncbi:chorismate mutase [Rhodoblastus acidophilus]|uniref:chorismate mutase n=1 Tax=Candidatus Rhodoblastus alkanivorans TaxID=2954117 RepID=A0ABS9Z124_9HYPH|nr:chorismate mutase [Candidatus Rhodoblastus alkanivorans]MCI4678548.1 chorismate mutase [Candidatus Rhodoblastus alkanivorans]MCI4681364.1 chorismate mutase [Candidatus Rhodoblastus alkanivorans]MDI4642412.1 chorismate mutase [Rhodoblastus acidophilus]
MTEPSALETLADLRAEIDRIDGEMHELLIERGEIIDRLIAAKARQGGGSAFRPGREADMMRVIAARHRGRLPLDTVESIWRVIIATFTFVQSPYAVHADMSGGDATMRDSARFHFGFTVPLLGHSSPDETIAAVAGSARPDGGGDLGMVRANWRPGEGRWWEALAAEDAPKIIARLPFVERPDHPAGMPVFIISNPLAEAAARDVALFAAQCSGEGPGDAALRAAGCESLARAPAPWGVSLFVAAPGYWDAARLRGALGEGTQKATWLGSHAERFALA